MRIYCTLYLHSQFNIDIYITLFTYNPVHYYILQFIIFFDRIMCNDKYDYNIQKYHCALYQKFTLGNKISANYMFSFILF